MTHALVYGASVAWLVSVLPAKQEVHSLILSFIEKVWLGWLVCYPSLLSPIRRVHISDVTYNCIKDEFEVEEGNGQSRDDYLLEHKVKTYLITKAKNKNTNWKKIKVSRIKYLYVFLPLMYLFYLDLYLTRGS